MKKVSELISIACSYLKKKQVQKEKRLAELIISHVLQVERLDLYLQMNREVSSSECASIQELLYKTGRHIPIEYVLGSVDFYGVSIQVNSSVLIPRVETEILFDHFYTQVKGKDLSSQTLVDLCCGSGCLGIAAKKQFPMLDVYLSDLSTKALTLAKKNAQKNQVELTLLKGSLLTPFVGKKIDYILCNPPYLSEKEYVEANNVFEPKLALVGGESGFEYFEELANELPGYLNPKGKVYFEIGYKQKKELIKIFNQSCWSKKEFVSDWSGHDRFFFLEIE